MQKKYIFGDHVTLVHKSDPKKEFSKMQCLQFAVLIWESNPSKIAIKMTVWLVLLIHERILLKLTISINGKS